MNPSRDFFTQSLFKLGEQCPTKLYYIGKKTEYANNSLDDPFLEALVEGGLQVGELARQYFSQGVRVESPDPQVALAETEQLLKQESVVIFDAAVKHGNLLARVDILEKTANHMSVIEVKPLLYDVDNPGEFQFKGKKIAAKARSSIVSVAFQRHVVAMAHPSCSVVASLFLLDKNSTAPSQSLHQKIRLATPTRDGEMRKTRVFLAEPLTEQERQHKILRRVGVDELCDQLITETYNIGDKKFTFAEFAVFLADHYTSDIRIDSPPGAICTKCEFRLSSDDMAQGLKSGFRECWKNAFGWSDSDCEQPLVLDIWNCRDKDKFLKSRKRKMVQVTEKDIGASSDGEPGMSLKERQWQQVWRVKKNISAPYVDRKGLREEMGGWRFPLHFIDFETSQAAIPFHLGRRPYSRVAFQFSHHSIDTNGRVAHAGQFLCVEPGVEPNYQFLRELKNQLESDSGSVFQYGRHERTTLRDIAAQLAADESKPADAAELLGFIECLAPESKDTEKSREGRVLIDLHKVVSRFHYTPAMQGSISLKKVLVAILNDSTILKSQYSAPVYGSTTGIPSLNFENHSWITFKQGKVVDPYRLLGPLLQDVSEHDSTILDNDEELRDGGAALVAYARLQSEDMPDACREKIKSALLRYCELDTLAMVFLYEAWKELLSDEPDSSGTQKVDCCHSH